MIPLSLDPARVKIVLVGRSDRLVNRMKQLQAAGADPVTVFTDEPQAFAGDGVVIKHGLPTAADLGGKAVIWAAELSEAEAQTLEAAADEAGVLLNVEDVLPYCDFHNVAQIRRGELLFTVSTGGRSPALASRLRRYLENRFGEEWTERIRQLGDIRAEMQRRGQPMAEVSKQVNDLIDREGWLICSRR